MTPEGTAVRDVSDAGLVAHWHKARSYLTTAYGEIAYHDMGEGPALLLIHGFPLNAYHWRDIMRMLAGERRCIAPDLLGLGYTRPAQGAAVDLHAQASMLVALLDGLGLPDVDVIANDSGTGVAQLLAVGYPNRVRSMLLTNGDVEPDSPPEPLFPVIELAQQGAFADGMIRSALLDKALARSAQGIIGMTYADPRAVSDETIDVYFAPLVESARRVALTNAYAASLLPNPLVDLEHRLRVCSVPTAILWGMADTLFKPEDIDYLASVLPDLRRVSKVDAAKLFFPEERPDLVAEAAQELWASLA